jgi:hypothetical protein
VPLRITNPRVDEQGFFYLEVPKNLFLEDIYFHPGRGTGIFNAGVEQKVVSATDMVIYKAVSPPASKFSFNAYVRQFETYRSLYNDRVTVLKKISDPRQREADEKATFAEILALYKDQILQMPQAEDANSLPELTGEDRRKASQVRKEVLQLYGLLPPDPKQPAVPACPYPVIFFYPPPVHYGPYWAPYGGCASEFGPAPWHRW